MMRAALWVALASAVALGAGCKKDDAAKPAPVAAAPSPGTVGADGVRRIPVEASAAGFAPDRIPGKPGEKLALEFTRTDDTECVARLKTPDGKLVDLPKGKAVEVALTVPATGELAFACSMDMYRGSVVATP